MSPRLELASLTHNADTSGAKSTMNNGLSDWNQETGTVQPNTLRSTKSFVYRVNELPACSKPAQKKTTKQVMIMITHVRCFSLRVNGALDFSLDSFVVETAGRLPASPKYLLANKLNSN